MDLGGRETAGWVMRFVSSDRLEGTRTDLRSSETLPIALRRTDPVDCSGKGPWRTFRSDRWPITFSYPAGWHASESDSLEIVCPDPGQLAWGGFPIILEQGAGFEPAAPINGNPPQRVGEFLRFGSGTWMRASDDECDPMELIVTRCSTARAARRLGITIVQANGGEDRIYRPGGGYVGQGGGTIVYLLVAGTRWVQIVSHDLPDWSDEIDRGGPARFDGTGITERMVRSIRPRPAR